MFSTDVHACWLRTLEYDINLLKECIGQYIKAPCVATEYNSSSQLPVKAPFPLNSDIRIHKTLIIQKEYLLNHTAPHSEYYVLHA